MDEAALQCPRGVARGSATRRAGCLCFVQLELLLEPRVAHGTAASLEKDSCHLQRHQVLLLSLKVQGSILPNDKGWWDRYVPASTPMSQVRVS